MQEKECPFCGELIKENVNIAGNGLMSDVLIVMSLLVQIQKFVLNVIQN